MMGINKPKGRLFSVSGVAAVLLSCTIGPRTPVEVATPYESQSARAPRDQSKDEGFRPPNAERVTNDSKNEEKGAKQPIARTSSNWGRAAGTLGSRPPWATLIHTDAGSDPGPVLSTTWTLQKTIPVGKGYLHQAAFSSNGSSVVTLSGENGEFFHYSVEGNLKRKILLPEFGEFEDVGFAVFSEIDRPQVVVARERGTSVVDLTSGVIDLLSETPAGNMVAHSGRPGLYGVTSRGVEPALSRLRLVWVSGEIALDLSCPGGISDWSLSKDGNTLALQYIQDNQVEVLSLKDNQMIARAKSPRFGGPVALSPSGGHLVIGGEKLVLFSLSSGKVIAEDTSYKNNIHDLRFSKRGELLLASSYDGKARSYALPSDLSTLESFPTPQLLPHLGEANVYAVELSQDERLLVTSSGDRTLKIWERK